MKKIIVTGGAGFIGSHLVDHLLEDPENEILVIDDFSEGKQSNLPQSSRLIVCQASILSDNLDKWGLFNNVDIVFHLAALTRPRWSIDYPVETNRVNVDGLLQILKYCISGKVGKFVFTSSASVYGKQSKLLLSEDMETHPMSPYALTKKIGEDYCNLYNELYGLRYDIIRPFNVYGPRQGLSNGYSAAVANFAHSFENNNKIYITGDGKQMRDFIYVKDVVKLMALVGNRDGSGEVFNAGSGESFSINKIYTTISTLLKKSKKINYIDPVIDPETKADIRKSLKLLNWKPNYSLVEGLKETINGIVK